MNEDIVLNKQEEDPDLLKNKESEEIITKNEENDHSLLDSDKVVEKEIFPTKEKLVKEIQAAIWKSTANNHPSPGISLSPDTEKERHDKNENISSSSIAFKRLGESFKSILNKFDETN